MAKQPKTPPIVLTIAGSDSSGGAGIQADLKTFTALGVYGASAITALTAQNTQGVRAVHAVPADFVTAQIDAVAEDLLIAAVKIGMLANADIMQAVARALDKHSLAPIVLDPVMVATSGDPLIEPQAIEALKGTLAPLATIITPNLDEAAVLLGEPRTHDLGSMEAQVRTLLDLGCGAVLLKGGHIAGENSVDVLATSNSVEIFEKPTVNSSNTHGTGCTLSAALAAHLALGQNLSEAVIAAKNFVWEGLKSGAAQNIGAGPGPVDHLWQSRQ